MSMTRFERILDAVHNFSVALARMTKPRWHFDRDRLVSFVSIGTALVTGVSAAIPQVKGLAIVANILAALQRTSEEVRRQLPQSTETTVTTPPTGTEGPPDLRVVPAESETSVTPSSQRPTG